MIVLTWKISRWRASSVSDGSGNNHVSIHTHQNSPIFRDARQNDANQLALEHIKENIFTHKYLFIKCILLTHCVSSLKLTNIYHNDPYLRLNTDLDVMSDECVMAMWRIHIELSWILCSFDWVRGGDDCTILNFICECSTCNYNMLSTWYECFWFDGQEYRIRHERAFQFLKSKQCLNVVCFKLDASLVPYAILVSHPTIHWCGCVSDRRRFNCALCGWPVSIFIESCWTECGEYATC